jgi:hypothetical protein
VENEALRICNEHVGSERRCLLFGRDGGIEGQAFFFTDDVKRIDFVIGTSYLYPIFKIKERFDVKDFKVYHCESSKCTLADLE